MSGPLIGGGTFFHLVGTKILSTHVLSHGTMNR